MANLNKIILVGHLTGDPEARTTTDSLAITKFRLAINRPISGGGSATDFVDVVTWRRVAEICAQYLKKGHLVLVEGRIQNRSFEDQTGQKRWVTEVVARSVTMLEKAVAGAKQSQVDSSSFSEDVAPEPEDEELFAETDLASDLPF